MEAQAELLPARRELPKRPLLKWAGGKSRLAEKLRHAMPKTFRRYAELFFGGGALFWSLGLERSILADSNPELITFYSVVRDHPAALLSAARELPVSPEDYYRIREIDPASLGPVEQAARLAYLNKTCFNGLYRVNRAGHFNTPYGAKQGAKILDEEDIYRASKLLKTCDLACADFTESLRLLEEGDFVYLDPPYLPIGGYSDFRRYTKVFFDEAHHIRLAVEFGKLADRGVLALMSNSDTEKIRCLYKSQYRTTVMAARQINCDGGKRGKIAELLVANYPLDMA